MAFASVAVSFLAIWSLYRSDLIESISLTNGRGRCYGRAMKVRNGTFIGVVCALRHRGPRGRGGPVPREPRRERARSRSRADDVTSYRFAGDRIVVEWAQAYAEVRRVRPSGTTRPRRARRCLSGASGAAAQASTPAAAGAQADRIRRATHRPCRGSHLPRKTRRTDSWWLDRSTHGPDRLLAAVRAAHPRRPPGRDCDPLGRPSGRPSTRCGSPTAGCRPARDHASRRPAADRPRGRALPGNRPRSEEAPNRAQ